VRRSLGGVALALGLVLASAAPAAVQSQPSPAPAPRTALVIAPGHFGGKLVLVVEFKKGFRPETHAGRTLWAIERPFYYRTKAGDLITVPAGMTTDLASIPRLVSGILPPDGPWLAAAMVHDELYATRGTANWHGYAGRTRAAPYTRAEADDILLEAMQALGVSGWQAWAIHTGVRAGGSAGWGT
jgi:hypothetical protein